jgi:tetratricopeptide (TPR) repeat protein
LIEDSLEKQTLALGFEHPVTLISAQVLADILLASGQLSDARSLYLSVLSAREKVFGGSHPELSETLLGLVYVSLRQDQHEQAENYLQQILGLPQQDTASNRQAIKKVLQSFVDYHKIIKNQQQVDYYLQKIEQI